MSDDDRVYFERRAEQEIACAQRSSNRHAVAVHYALSELYLARVAAADDGRGDEKGPSQPADRSTNSSDPSRSRTNE